MLFVRFFICNETSFKCCHLIFAEKRRVFAEPKIPHDITRTLILIQSVRFIKFPSDFGIQEIHICFSFMCLAVYSALFKITVVSKWNAPVIQKIAVDAFIK